MSDRRRKHERLERQWYERPVCRRCGRAELRFDHRVDCGEGALERHVTCVVCGYRCIGVFEPRNVADL